MDLHFHNLQYVTPPGSLTQFLSHPYYSEGFGVELSIFNDHRYAFFFWNKWTQKLIDDDRIGYPPCVVTLDWHQDLVYPTETEKQWLDQLDLSNNKDVSLYAWANLRSLNDTHVMAAAYLNLIGNIYVNCRQGSSEDDWEDEHFTDKFGNIHTVKKFQQYEELENYLLTCDENNVYLDIDLDFFTLNNPLQIGGGKGDYTYLPDAAVKKMLNSNRPLITWIFQRLQGVTIATEPEHTGGLIKSYKYLDLINRIWFDPSLFTSYPGQWEKRTNWKHKK